VLLFLIVAITLFIFGLYTLFSSKNELEQNGKRTNAIITNIHHTSSSFNQLSGESINNYHLFYRFEVEGKQVNGNQVIATQEYHSYFEFKKEVGDSICVMYLPNDMNISKVCLRE